LSEECPHIPSEEIAKAVVKVFSWLLLSDAEIVFEEFEDLTVVVIGGKIFLSPTTVVHFESRNVERGAFRLMEKVGKPTFVSGVRIDRAAEDGGDLEFVMETNDLDYAGYVAARELIGFWYREIKLAEAEDTLSPNR